MRNIYDVLRLKEQQAEQLQKEIEALQLAIKILDEADTAANHVEVRPITSAAPIEAGFGASVSSAKRFP